MRVVFMGTPHLAAMILEEIAGKLDVALVVTRPDSVSGRGAALRPSAVRASADRLGIPVIQASKIDGAVVEQLEQAAPDAICVAAFGCILPESVLGLPRLGCFNIHMSLLPRWRGAAPLERAILAGDEQVGYSIMLMEKGLDTGPYCYQGTVCADGLYLSDIERAFAKDGARALCAALSGIDDGTMEWKSQDDGLATYAEKIGKDELALSPQLTVSQNHARVRVSSAAHPARTVVAGRQVTVLRVHPVAPEEAPVGLENPQQGLSYYSAKRLFLACSDGLLEVGQIKPSGKGEMDGKAFAAGVQNFKKEPKPWGE